MDRAGPVRPSRAPVLRLWTLTPRAALLAAALLFTKSHFEVGCRYSARMVGHPSINNLYGGVARELGKTVLGIP